MRPLLTFAVALVISALDGENAAANGFLGDGELRALQSTSVMHECAHGRTACPRNLHLAGRSFSVSTLDLNDDRVLEISLKDENACGSAGCQTSLVKNQDNAWIVVFEGYNITVLKAKTEAYHDIVLGFRGFDEEVQAYCWTGDAYKQCYKVNVIQR